MDSRVSIPLLDPPTSYLEQKLKMISSLKRQGLYEISIGDGEYSYEDPSDWLYDCDRTFGSIYLAISPSMCYHIDFVEYPQDLQKELDRFLGKHNEDPSIYVESTFISSMNALSRYVLASAISDEVDHDEEVSHTIFSVATLFDSNTSFFNQEENIEEQYFSLSLEVD